MLVGIFVATTVVGCAGEAIIVCPAIGYSSSVSVQLTGDTSRIEEVHFCDPDGDCSHMEPVAMPSEASPSPLPGGADLWTVSPLNPPARATITALYGGGIPAAEVDTEIAWERVGGTAECGGRPRLVRSFSSWANDKSPSASSPLYKRDATDGVCWCR